MNQSMKLQEKRLAMPLLRVLLWVLFIHAGTFASATLLPAPITGNGPSHRSALSTSINVRVTHRDLNESISFARTIIDSLKRLEMNLIRSNIEVKHGTPSHGTLISFGPEDKAIERGNDALIALKASVLLINSICNNYRFDFRECSKFISKFTFLGTSLASSCNHLKKVCTPEEYNYLYQSSDGSCNNIKNGDLGESFTAYSRLLNPDYMDGVHVPRRAVNKNPLPTPRSVSVSLVKNKEVLNDRYTLAVMQWGQFVEHDLSHTATAKMVHSDHSIECCESDGKRLSPRYMHPFCLPIMVPPIDRYNNEQGLDCINYVRSIPAMRSDCSFGSADQINQATHYLDGSQIYGSTFKKTSNIREFKGGQLKHSTFNSKSFLPLSPTPTEDCQVTSNSSTCFVSGDSRVNFQPQLTAMHTLWFREHNRIAKELGKLNTEWDDETLFQEARKIVIAEMQQITYNEWLIAVLAPKYIQRINKHKEYSDQVDPSVSNSFATAAIRALKSMYIDKISLIDENRQENSSVTIKLHQYFNKPDIIEKPGIFDSLIRSLATQPSQNVDLYYTEDLTNKLYSDGHFGYDVLSFDISRSRDHGLPSYNHFRSLCGRPEARSFEDLSSDISLENIKALKKVYANPKDIDLIIGGLVEKTEPGSLLGPTFSCIVADQFQRTRRGDRYFFTNEKQPQPFTELQLAEIQKVTLARIFCDNSDDVKMMQLKVFEKISHKNNLVKCDGEEIQRISFIPWMVDRIKYSY